MNTDVGNDAQRPGVAQRPERTEVAAVDANNAGVEAVRIEIVVENEIDDAPPAILLTPRRNVPLSRLAFRPR